MIKSVKVNESNYAIKQIKQPIMDGETIDGYLQYSNLTIKLKRKLIDEYKLHVLWHEIVHAIEGAYDCPLDDDMDVRNHKMDVLSKGIIAIIRDNPQLIQDTIGVTE